MTDPVKELFAAIEPLLEAIGGDPLAFLEEMQKIQTEGDGAGRGAGSNLGSLVRRLPSDCISWSMRR
mgnify:CR=1 FL=1